MLFPNKFAHDNFLSAERELVFPDEIQRKMGIRLRTALPAGAGKSIERVKVLATSKRVARLNNQESGDTATIAELEIVPDQHL